MRQGERRIQLESIRTTRLMKRIPPGVCQYRDEYTSRPSNVITGRLGTVDRVPSTLSQLVDGTKDDRNSMSIVNQISINNDFQLVLYTCQRNLNEPASVDAELRLTDNVFNQRPC